MVGTTPRKERTICFDLEGPLSPQDNAYEVMKLMGDDGARIFEMISRYDDIISLQGRAGYEPGDTLALIVPFLLAHGITEADIRRVSARAKIVDGAITLFRQLQTEGWDIYIISTSYEQHAHHIGRQLGVSEDHTLCTQLNLENLGFALSEAAFTLLNEAQDELLGLYTDLESEKTDQLTRRLDELFFQQLPALGFEIFSTRVVGGERKAEAVRTITAEKGISVRDIIAVGDSITDYKMLNEVALRGGIAVVFNGNEYAVPYANVGLASIDIRFLSLICEAFTQHGKEAVMELVTSWELNRDRFANDPAVIPNSEVSAGIRAFLTSHAGNLPFPYFHNVERADDRKRAEIIAIHKRFRMQVREDAGKLG
ncbi:MAG: HAD hydrolase family protein [Methanomicrobia archaeon]|nr:HAD hydrolase family protein [Methanomicrobia archaeon]